jgi:hypothetical protein
MATTAPPTLGVGINCKGMKMDPLHAVLLLIVVKILLPAESNATREHPYMFSLLLRSLAAQFRSEA